MYSQVKQKGKPYIKVFEACIKRPITEGEYSTTYYEFVTVEYEVENASKTDTVGIETREICVTYYIWLKIIKDTVETDNEDYDNV